MQITVGQGTHIARRLSYRCVDARILAKDVVFACWNIFEEEIDYWLMLHLCYVVIFS